MKVIYTGSIRVSADDYLHPSVKSDGNYHHVEIDGLDDLVTRRSQLTFQLGYPFTRPYDGRLIADSGITLRQVIDAIRMGFRTMYLGAAHQSIPGFLNQRVWGDYGEAFHAIGDLVIEKIVLDEATGRLDIWMGS